MHDAQSAETDAGNGRIEGRSCRKKTGEESRETRLCPLCVFAKLSI